LKTAAFPLHDGLGALATCALPSLTKLNSLKLIIPAQPGGAYLKKSELEKRLKQLGWNLKRQGGSHEIWTNGKDIQAVPRHKEIKEGTAKGILEFAGKNPGK
jgi:mRNA interferase HicA